MTGNNGWLLYGGDGYRLVTRDNGPTGLWITTREIDKREPRLHSFIAKLYARATLNCALHALYRLNSMKEIGISVKKDSWCVIKLNTEIRGNDNMKIKCAPKRILVLFYDRLRRKQFDCRISNGNLMTTDTRNEIKLENSICYVSHMS